MRKAALVAVLWSSLAAEAGAVRRCRADERGRVVCQPIEALSNRSAARPKARQHKPRREAHHCTWLANGTVVCGPLLAHRPRPEVLLFDRTPPELPELVAPPESFR